MNRRLTLLVAVVVAISVLSLPRSAGAVTSMLYVADPTGDTQPSADISNATIDYWRDAITVTLDVQNWTDPYTDSTWKLPNGAEASWAFDTNDDGGADYLAVLIPDGLGGLSGKVFFGSERRCNADVVVAAPGYRLSFGAGCIGSPPSVKFGAYFQYGSGQSSAHDSAPDNGYAGPVSPSAEARSNGGFVTDSWGGLQTFRTDGVAPPAVVASSPYWPGQDVARGNAATFGGGFVLDDWGGIHLYKTGSSGTFIGTHGGPYWPGQDVARGIAMLSSGTGGYVLDDWGGLHPFGVGDSPAPPLPQGGPYWPGQDVARGVAVLPDGSGGYIVDSWGAFHPFVIPGPGHAMPPKPTDGPYWQRQDVARGVVVDAEGNGGYVLDDWGGIHPFSIPGTAGPVPAPSGGPYWPGQDVARGISVVPEDPPPAPPPPS